MMMLLKKTWIVSKYTFVEAYKSRVLVNIVFLGLALVALCYVAAEFTYGVPERVAIDFGLGALTLSSVAIAVFMGAGLLTNEIQDRTIYMVLSRPIGRGAFFLGKIVGLSMILLLNVMVLAALTLGFYGILGGSFSELLLWCVFFCFCEALLILFVVVFLSLFTNVTLSVIFSIVIYTIGHALSDTMKIGLVQREPILMKMINAYSWFFPNFSRLNIKDFVLYQQGLATEYLAGNLAYVMVYSLLIISVSMYIFNRKNLD